MPSPKRKRVTVTIQQRLDIIRQLEEGKRPKVLALEYNIGANTVRDIRKNKDKILGYSMSSSDFIYGMQNRKTMKKSPFELLNKALLRWFHEQRSLGRPVTGAMCTKQAKILFVTLGLQGNFDASSGWLERFKDRHGIRTIGDTMECVCTETRAENESETSQLNEKSTSNETCQSEDHKVTQPEAVNENQEEVAPIPKQSSQEVHQSVEGTPSQVPASCQLKAEKTKKPEEVDSEKRKITETANVEDTCNRNDVHQSVESISSQVIGSRQLKPGKTKKPEEVHSEKTKMSETANVEDTCNRNDDFSNLKAVVKRLETISDKLTAHTLGDSYAEFGRYISTLLRGLPPRKVLSMKQKMVADVMQALIDHERKSNQTLPRKGVNKPAPPVTSEVPLIAHILPAVQTSFSSQETTTPNPLNVPGQSNCTTFQSMLAANIGSSNNPNITYTSGNWQILPVKVAKYVSGLPSTVTSPTRTDGLPSTITPLTRPVGLPSTVTPLTKTDCLPSTVTPLTRTDGLPSTVTPLTRTDCLPSSVTPLTRTDGLPSTVTPLTRTDGLPSTIPSPSCTDGLAKESSLANGSNCTAVGAPENPPRSRKRKQSFSSILPAKRSAEDGSKSGFEEEKEIKEDLDAIDAPSTFETIIFDDHRFIQVKEEAPDIEEIEEIPSEPQQLVCDLCPEQFSLSQDVVQHFRQLHSGNVAAKLDSSRSELTFNLESSDDEEDTFEGRKKRRTASEMLIYPGEDDSDESARENNLPKPSVALPKLQTFISRLLSSNTSNHVSNSKSTSLPLQSAPDFWDKLSLDKSVQLRIVHSPVSNLTSNYSEKVSKHGPQTMLHKPCLSQHKHWPRTNLGVVLFQKDLSPKTSAHSHSSNNLSPRSSSRGNTAAGLDSPRSELMSNLESSDDEENTLDGRKTRRTTSKTLIYPGEYEDSDESSRENNLSKSSVSLPELQTFISKPLSSNSVSNSKHPLSPLQSASDFCEELSLDTSVQQKNVPSPVANLTSNCLEEVSKHEPLQKDLSPKTSVYSHSPNNHSPRSSSRDKQIYKIILQVQATLTDAFSRIKSVEEKVDKRCNQISQDVFENEDDGEMSLLRLFPVNSMADFEALESKLKESPLLRKNFVNIMMAVGGADAKILSINIMRRLMSDQLATVFSYTGKKGYKEGKTVQFGNTQICSNVHAAVRKVYADSTNELIKKQIMGFLNQARTRLSRREQERQRGENIGVVK